MDEQVQDETLDSQNEATEEVEKTEIVEETAETVETEDAEKLKDANKRLFERAKKAEAENKVLKAKQEVKVEVPAQTADPDELRLIAKGLSDQEIDQAKVIAKGRGISLPEALKDPLLIAYRKELEEQRRKEKAKLGASKGSGQADDEILVKPGTTLEEHRLIWEKALGR